MEELRIFLQENKGSFSWSLTYTPVSGHEMMIDSIGHTLSVEFNRFIFKNDRQKMIELFTKLLDFENKIPYLNVRMEY